MILARILSRLQPDLWYMRLGLHLLCLLPALGLLAALLQNELGPDPAKELILESGEWALRWLLLCLSITPLRHLTGSKRLILWRRPLGLWAAAWAGGHLLMFAVLYIELSFSYLLEELAEHPYITAGFAAVMLLLPLAMTSNRAAVRRLGGERWRKLHWAVYPAALLAVIHLVWQIREEWGEAMFYSLWLGTLFGFRLWLRRRGASAAATGA